MTSKTSEARARLTAALGRCIADSPEALRNPLAQAIDDYAKAVGPRTWNKLAGGAWPALFSEVLDTLVESSDARPGMED